MSPSTRVRRHSRKRCGARSRIPPMVIRQPYIYIHKCCERLIRDVRGNNVPAINRCKSGIFLSFAGISSFLIVCIMRRGTSMVK